ncbi:unnamed protein product [Blepharisma stoltei]|uniref:Uncharacterized protein n=1 Tax=Blepharisma stoltei TaxID=1481888 RepID=A0AAU9K8D0_9CILI|nr:unnamed protein product [Blepharisma stoltei]
MLKSLSSRKSSYSRSPKHLLLPSITPKSVRGSFQVEDPHFSQLSTFAGREIRLKSSYATKEILRRRSINLSAEDKINSRSNSPKPRRKNMNSQLPSIKEYLEKLQKTDNDKQKTDNVTSASVQVKKSVSRIRKLISHCYTPA